MPSKLPDDYIPLTILVSPEQLEYIQEFHNIKNEGWKHHTFISAMRSYDDGFPIPEWDADKRFCLFYQDDEEGRIMEFHIREDNFTQRTRHSKWELVGVFPNRAEAKRAIKPHEEKKIAEWKEWRRINYMEDEEVDSLINRLKNNPYMGASNSLAE